MLGAIIGDIAGSRFEFNNHRSTDFELFGAGCSYTDDTIMTVAVADAIMSGASFKDALQGYGQLFPSPMGGYGGRFSQWLHSLNPQPYDSFGNGAAMRVSPCAFFYRNDREKALSAAASSAMCSHNHPEGIKGAMAVVDTILMAFDRIPKREIRERVSLLYGYDLNFSCDDIRDTNTFNETCQVTIPQAIVAFLDSRNFTNAIKLAVSIGGDSDTIAAITGGIAEAYYGISENMRKKVLMYLPRQLRGVVESMYNIT